MSAVITYLRASRRPVYRGRLAGERAKEKRAAQYNLPEGTPAGQDYVKNVYLPSLQTGTTPTTGPAQTVTTTPVTEAAPATGGLFDSLPNKIFGIPTYMWIIGGVLVMLVVFKKK